MESKIIPHKIICKEGKKINNENAYAHYNRNKRFEELESINQSFDIKMWV